MNNYLSYIPIELAAVIISYTNTEEAIDYIIKNSVKPETFEDGNIWRSIYKYKFGDIDLSYITGINYSLKNRYYYITNYISLWLAYKHSIEILDKFEVKISKYLLLKYNISSYNELIKNKSKYELDDINKDIRDDISEYYNFEASGLIVYKLLNYKQDHDQYIDFFKHNKFDTSLILHHDINLLKINSDNDFVPGYDTFITGLTKEHTIIILMYIFIN